ncbi:MAG TPA: hypothetical protein IAB38_01820 [Candidatus Onthousia excrementipullorum]|uniref:Uncharacterized protein n=1 Tax=Candidatus Onthousia excrementipullorum TaxID=2840884 RepID=A0A9D1J346_9FIRM|nr:hypothetical protein [Candidatus Onthousia excrementipullorum]
MDYNLIYQELLLDIKNSNLAFNIRKSLNDIYNDKDLISLINKYRETEDETIKKEIYNNEKFMRYKRLENETNLLIMKLNKIFKEIGERDENN